MYTAEEKARGWRLVYQRNVGTTQIYSVFDVPTGGYLGQTVATSEADAIARIKESMFK